ncbi:MAG TPA: cytochrome d ubiquinol oxidase subunit II [Candidatus Acidoferrum sp.]|nr:cytochrome d ubiquinol oxidase subunit II [Candidatus Acidoferrum sp.]
MTAAEVTAVVLWVGVTAYAVFGGADFGGGFWDLVAGGAERGLRPRALIADAIGPVWEANHTWLIFDLVILWTAFPVAFAAIMSTLFVPLSLAAFGIVLRGAAFAFRPVAAGLPARRAAGAVFAASSVVTPFFLGTVAGAIAGGRVVVGDGPRDLIGSWLNPTSVLVGALAVSTCAYLAAVFLVADARRLRDDDLAAYFLRRATLAAVAAGALSMAGILVLWLDVRSYAEKLAGAGLLFVIAAATLGTVGLVRLQRGATRGTRVLAVGAVVAVVWGWGVSQYPDILPGALSISAAAAPSGSQEALLVVFIVAALVIAPSLGLLYTLDQRSRLEAHGIGKGPV